MSLKENTIFKMKDNLKPRDYTTCLPQARLLSLCGQAGIYTRIKICANLWFHILIFLVAAIPPACSARAGRAALGIEMFCLLTLEDSS